MSMKQQLTDDMKAAMKAGEKHKLGVIRQRADSWKDYFFEEAHAAPGS